MAEPVDDEPKSVDIELYMEALQVGGVGALKASRYLGMVAELCRGIEDAVNLLASGRHLEAHDRLVEIHKAAAAKLGTA
jgi:hypothetical protein